VPPPSLSEAAQRFLVHQIGSVERLDLLLYLYRNAARWCSAETLSNELSMPAPTVQPHLEHLSARNLLDVRLAESVLYRYQPGREELSALVEEVTQAHYHHRDEVVAVLTRPAADPARLFAEAFQFRKGKRDG
jgi:hypothetical protein